MQTKERSQRSDLVLCLSLEHKYYHFLANVMPKGEQTDFLISVISGDFNLISSTGNTLNFYHRVARTLSWLTRAFKMFFFQK